MLKAEVCRQQTPPGSSAPYGGRCRDAGRRQGASGHRHCRGRCGRSSSDGGAHACQRASACSCLQTTPSPTCSALRWAASANRGARSARRRRGAAWRVEDEGWRVEGGGWKDRHSKCRLCARLRRSVHDHSGPPSAKKECKRLHYFSYFSDFSVQKYKKIYI